MGQGEEWAHVQGRKEQAGLGCAAGGLELCGWSLAGPEGEGSHPLQEDEKLEIQPGAHSFAYTVNFFHLSSSQKFRGHLTCHVFGETFLGIQESLLHPL